MVLLRLEYLIYTIKRFIYKLTNELVLHFLNEIWQTEEENWHSKS